jgi:hypothetical protein
LREKLDTTLPPLVHGFEAEDWLACWSMHLKGTLVSVDVANELEFGLPGARGLATDDLREGNLGGAFLSLRMLRLRQAAIIRSGGWVGEGAPPYPTLRASTQVSERVVRLADLELCLEKGRRDLAAGAPSRIGCLFLAENSAAGRTTTSELKGHDAFIMQVRIKYRVRIARTDARWLDDDIGDEKIAGYWSGSPRGQAPQWEYLLDGAIECADEGELGRLRSWAPEAGLRASGSQGPIGTPR